MSLTEAQRGALGEAIIHIRQAQEDLTLHGFEFASYLLDVVVLDLSVELGSIQCEAAIAGSSDPMIEAMSAQIRRSDGE